MTTQPPSEGQVMRTALELVAIGLVAVGGFILAAQQSRVNSELDELNGRSQENQVLRCYELGLAGEPLDPKVSAICLDALGVEP